MSELLFGNRIGRTAQIRSGVAAYIENDAGEILLTRRTDNGRWCLPGGHIDPGESAAEACAREVEEETGLQVRIGRLIGVYSSPGVITRYPDGNLAQFVSLCFEAVVEDGVPHTSSETTEVRFVGRAEAGKLDIMETHLLRIADAQQRQEAAFVR